MMRRNPLGNRTSLHAIDGTLDFLDRL